MFEKLLAVLPYNPGLAHQLAFYSRRMRQEAAIRRIGMVFIVLAFMVQFFAFISPPQSTVASSSNDLITGGISSAADAANQCNQNTRNYQNILANYAINCAQVAAASSLTINACGQDYYSFGHIPQGFPSEQPVNIPNGGTIYVRKLSGFGCANYHVLKLTASTGKNFFIIYDCGNLVSIGIPTPVTPCQYNPNIAASSPQCFNPCQYNNTIPASSPECFNKCQYNPTIPASSPQCYNKCRYDSSLPASSPQCFEHCPVAGKTNLHKSDSACTGPCKYNASLQATSPRCVPPPGTTGTPPTVAVCPYNGALPTDSPLCVPPKTVCKYNSSLPDSSPLCYQPCQYNSSLPASSPDCKPCDKSVSSSDKTACIAVHKTAANLTTGTADANNTTVKGGDVINYTLYAQNGSKDTIKDYLFQENLSDVLDYADVTDFHGGTIDANQMVSWPKVDIKSGATATVQVTVKVKDPVPQTPVSSSDPNHFDLTMTNVYGNTIVIKLPGSPEKTVEATAASLPNTGPGTSLMVAAAILMVGGYFYSRARLLAVESNVALQESAAA